MRKKRLARKMRKAYKSKINFNKLDVEVKRLFEDVKDGIAGISMKYKAQSNDNMSLVEELADFYMCELGNMILHLEEDTLLDITAYYHKMKKRFKSQREEGVSDIQQWYMGETKKIDAEINKILKNERIPRHLRINELGQLEPIAEKKTILPPEN